MNRLLRLESCDFAARSSERVNSEASYFVCHLKVALRFYDEAECVGPRKSVEDTKFNSEINNIDSTNVVSDALGEVMKSPVIDSLRMHICSCFGLKISKPDITFCCREVRESVSQL